MKYLSLLSILPFVISSCFICPECEECEECKDPIPPPEAPQKAGFKHLETYDSSFYYLSLNRAHWTEAKTNCEQAGGHLVSIHSQDENDIVLKVMGFEHGWIGLTDKDSEGIFEWITGETVSFINWNTGEPNNELNDDYVIIHGLNHPNPGTWNDSPNEMNYYYVLEIPY